MKILANVITFLLVLGIPSFFVLISFNFTGAAPAVVVFDEKPEVIPYTVKIENLDGGKQTIAKMPINLQGGDTISIDSSQAGYIEFGKLATAFFMPNQSGSISFQDITLSGTVLTIDPQYSSIVSMYDPFTIYTIESVYKDFSVSEITNGSLYIGRERDGTYSFYSIDAVVRLDFLDKGNKMTDMVLFPGMYIRFDPRMNATLSGANLFRILQSLEPDGTEDVSVDSTGIEFVNPRMNTQNEKDSFLMYRLPTQTRLFQMLHILFYDRVSQIDVYKEYGTAIGLYSDESSSNPNLINPGKKSHLLLLALDGVLANALKNSVSIDNFKQKITEVNASAHDLGLGNSVEARLERFLTDGRFALFGGTKNAQFADIYQAASEAVGRAPVTPHAKLLQRLSDIYSKNLVTQKKDLSFSSIDTYTPTAMELEKTLQSTDIQQRDYFDIALYAFNVLKKMEDKGIFTEEAVAAHPTYSLIQTVLISTDRYVRDIQDIEKKNTTYEGIALHFYFHIISTLTHSVYNSYMSAEDGRLYLKSSYKPDKNQEKVGIDESLIRDMSNVDSILSVVSERMDEQYGVNSTNNTYLSIKKHIALYNAFIDILDLDYESYRTYEDRPYLLDDSTEYLLPQYQSGEVLRYDPTKVVEQPVSIDDPSIESIVSALGNISPSRIKKDIDGYYVNNAEITLTPTNADPINIAITMVISPDLSSFTNPVLTYNNRPVYILTDKKSFGDIGGMLDSIPQYISRLDAILAGNPGLVGGVRFLDTTKKIAIGTYIFPLVP